MEYFQRDFSEKELEQLEGLLQGPEENAMRFAGQAELFYRSLKLPEVGGRTHWLRWMAVPLAIGLGAWLLWKPAQKVEAPVPLPAAVTVPKASLSAKPTLRPARPKGLDYDLLSVQLELKETRLVTVRVLDSEGAEIRSLFAGMKDAGDWDFRWDGKMNGQPVAPGSYTIEVRSGDLRQTKAVQIDAAP